jgi:hypothetical protein
MFPYLHDYLLWINSFKALLIIIVIVNVVVVSLSRKLDGNVLLTWKSTAISELQKNGARVFSFAFAFILLIIIETWSTYFSVYIICVDILILLAIEYTFLMPKRYVVTTKGILISGRFRYWTEYKSYTVSENLGLVTLRFKRGIGSLRPFQVLPMPRNTQQSKLVQLISTYVD